MWPVTLRELQAEARHSFTYWLRVLGAGAALLAAVWVLVITYVAANEGGLLFSRLHLTLFCSIWLLVPMVTADCISRERREGTLGLLFLTPLTARSIVVAKGLAHGLRAMTLCLAVLPVLTIPFLMGGVSWQEAVISATTNLSSFCWALAAGLLASSRTRGWVQSLAWALIVADLFGLIFGVLQCLAYDVVLSSNGLGSYSGQFNWSWYSVVGFFLASDVSETCKRLLLRLPPTGQSHLLWASGATALISLGTLFLLTQLASRNVRRRWQEEPLSARRLWWARTFCTPILWLRLFRRWMRWKLERNPI